MVDVSPESDEDRCDVGLRFGKTEIAAKGADSSDSGIPDLSEHVCQYREF